MKQKITTTFQWNNQVSFWDHETKEYGKQFISENDIKTGKQIFNKLVAYSVKVNTPTSYNLSKIAGDVLVVSDCKIDGIEYTSQMMFLNANDFTRSKSEIVKYLYKNQKQIRGFKWECSLLKWFNLWDIGAIYEIDQSWLGIVYDYIELKK